MTLTPTLYMADTFLEAFSSLPSGQRKKVREFVGKFRSDPTTASINYEPIRDVRDERVHTVRVDRAYRAVVLHPQSGADYVLVWVDHHDAAMDWAKNKIFPVHPVTGALQVLDLQWVDDANTRNVEEAADKSLDAYALFETFSNTDLVRSGVPEMLLPSVRALRTADELERLWPNLPAEAYETLFYIANLGCSVDEACAHAGILPSAATAGIVDPADVTTALTHPDSRRRFHMIDSTEELEDILDAPMDKWRIFLHPSQAQLVERHFNGPARVLGGAGTGKTVVAMHRARHLARSVFTGAPDRILFTTFTRNLAANIRQNLENLCGPEMERIEVTNLHAWAVRFLHGLGRPVAIANEGEIRQCWRNAIEQARLQGWNEGFLQHEWATVIQAQGIQDRSTYLRASRQGQGAPLNRNQRAIVWPVFEAYRSELARLGKLEWPGVIHLARLALEKQQAPPPYCSIVVDETQDLDPEELRLLRTMVPAGPNDLFFVGDGHQRIYGRPVVMSQCGIVIRGRAAKLRINYRTTAEIQRWATGVLTGVAVDDLDGGEDELHTYHSLMNGPPPNVRSFATLVEECAYVIDEVRALLETTDPERICLVARTHSQLRDDYLPALRAAGFDFLLLEADTPDYAGSGVRLATMHRVKGLEFEHVLIVGLRAGVVPPPQAITEEDLLRERCLLHVAASRARETLTVTAWGTPSVLMDLPG